jgi:CRP-like cAMP-binding protein
MAKPPLATDPSENRLLDALPAADRARLIRHMDQVTFERGEIVYRSGGPIRHVYFPRTGILSHVIDMADGGTVEVGTIGREGLSGLALAHGTDRSLGRVYCQVPPCVCRRLPGDVFVAELRTSARLTALTHRYAQCLLDLAAQSVGCNRLHPVEKRLARWLLMSHDRIDGDRVSLTQQILSEMLGVRRSSVTTAAGVLQKAQLIEYRRGTITVLNRRGLESAACECYHVVRGAFDRLLAV